METLTTKKMVTPPPNNGKPVVHHIDTFVSQLYKYSSRLYLNPDEAYRQSKDQARAMRRDPVIMQPLRQRQLATALLDWQIQPEDSDDPVQKKVCEDLTAIVKRVPYFLKLRMCLLEAVWFGRYAVQLGYEWAGEDFNDLSVCSWVPFHGDKLAFEQDTGKVGIFVGQLGTKADDLRYGPEARVRMFSDYERESIIVHKHEVEDGDFFEAEVAGGIHGVGLRTRVYWPWWIKQTSFQWLMTFLERAGLGVTVWYYESGNDEDYKATKAAAENLASDTIILAPMPIGSERPFKRYERVEPGMSGADMFKGLMDDYLGGQIRGMIVGQEATSQKMSTGLGSEIANVQKDTFRQINMYDAINLGETITNDFLKVLAKYNYPGIDWTPKFECVLKETDPKGTLEAAKMFQDMGGEVGEDQLREVIGLPKPGPEDKILSQVQQNPFGEMPPLDPQGSTPEDVEPKNGDRVDLPDGEYDIDEVRDAMRGGDPRKFSRWKESDHPRDDDGKFTDGDGGGDAAASPYKPQERKPRERRFIVTSKDFGYAIRLLKKRGYKFDPSDKTWYGTNGDVDFLVSGKYVEDKSRAPVKPDPEGHDDDIHPDGHKPTPEEVRSNTQKVQEKKNDIAQESLPIEEGTPTREYITDPKNIGRKVRVVGGSQNGKDGILREWSSDISGSPFFGSIKLSNQEEYKIPWAFLRFYKRDESPEDSPKQKTLDDYEKDRRAVQESVAKHGHAGGKDLSGFTKGELELRRDRERHPLFAESQDIERGRERQGRLFSRIGEPVRYKGEWKTIGKGNHGAKVYIENGVITKGCPGLMGHEVDDIPTGNDDYESSERSDAGKKWDERSQNKQTRDSNAYAHAKRRQQARKEGLSPDEVEDVYEWLKGQHQQDIDSHNSLVRAARKAAGVSGRSKEIARGVDSDSISTKKRGIDDVAEELANSTQFAHHFVDSDDWSGTLFDKLAEGLKDPKSDDQLWNDAMEIAWEHGRIPQESNKWVPVQFVRYENPIQFAKGMHSPKGGITIQGTFFPGGQFIPSSVLAKASSEEKAKLQATRQGYEAVKRNEDKSYHHADDAKLDDEFHERVKALRLPPAWTGVQVSSDPKSPLQAIGYDEKGRVQYRYSAEHSAAQAAKKFARVEKFVEKLPQIRQRINEALDGAEGPDKEAAAVLYLIDKTGFRVGSDRDTMAEKKAHGATTLDSSHLVVDGDEVTFSFVGKKGVDIKQTVQDGRLASMLLPRAKRGGKLFDTTDSKVRDFLHQIAGNFKVKDFRTAVAADQAMQAIESLEAPKSEKEYKQKRLEVGKIVADKLGNTPTVALASYIPPEVFAPWQAKMISSPSKVSKNSSRPSATTSNQKTSSQPKTMKKTTTKTNSPSKTTIGSPHQPLKLQREPSFSEQFAREMGWVVDFE